MTGAATLSSSTPTTISSIVSSIPSPSSNSFSIGPLQLNAYGLMIALGVLAAVWLLGKRLDQRGWGTADDASAIGMWGVGAGVVGARLYHVATEWDRFSSDLGAIPKIWEGGLGIPGGLLAGVAAGLWAGRRRGIAPGRILTGAAPAVPLAQAIGRVGNWFNQELFGRPTDLPWALEIDDAHTPAGFTSDTTFHPTFLYESLWNLALVGVLLAVERRWKLAPGRLFAVYVLGYGIGRYWIEGLRIDNVSLADVAGLRWNQWVALAAIIGGAGYLVATRRQEPEAAVIGGSGDARPGASTGDLVDAPDGLDGSDGSDGSDGATEIPAAVVDVDAAGVGDGRDEEFDGDLDDDLDDRELDDRELDDRDLDDRELDDDLEVDVIVAPPDRET